MTTKPEPTNQLPTCRNGYLDYDPPETHSPLPWRVGVAYNVATIWDERQMSVCDMPAGADGSMPQSHADADLIVEAVNSRPALVARIADLEAQLAAAEAREKKWQGAHSEAADLATRAIAQRDRLAEDNRRLRDAVNVVFADWGSDPENIRRKEPTHIPLLRAALDAAGEGA